MSRGASPAESCRRRGQHEFDSKRLRHGQELLIRQSCVGRVDQREQLLAVALEAEASSEEAYGLASPRGDPFAKWIGFDAEVGPAVSGSHLYWYPIATDMVADGCSILE